MEISQLVLQFERDWEARRYPYLGQACMMGVAYHLLDGCCVKRPVEFSPHYGSPAAQIQMEGVLQGDGRAVERFKELAEWSPPPFWCPAQDGWRTARCLQAALESGGAESAGVVDIIGPLSAEIDDWLALMAAACEAEIRFQVDIEPCDDPPADLVRWVEREFAETSALICEALEEAGIEITDEPEEGEDIS